jgi:hypothetical protein
MSREMRAMPKTFVAAASICLLASVADAGDRGDPRLGGRGQLDPPKR